MTVESYYAIAIATLNRWFKNLAPLIQLMRRKARFFRTLSKLQFIARNSEWFIALFAPVVINRSNYFGFGFSTVI